MIAVIAVVVASGVVLRITWRMAARVWRTRDTEAGCSRDADDEKGGVEVRMQQRTTTPELVWRVSAESDRPVLRMEPADHELAPPMLLHRGVVIVDKPAGCTSHDVVNHVRRLFNMRRVGHSGTLDPEVTGVLPIGLGQATAILSLLLQAGKTYECEMVVHADCEAAVIEQTLKGFVGQITQLPPVRSRVKRVERQREIYDLAIQRIDQRRVFFRVACEAGTYIRKLCHDAGQKLGCGGHMAKLRRLAAGGFTIAQAVTLEQLQQAATQGGDAVRRWVWPLERAIPADMPRVWVDAGCLNSLASGASLAAPGILAYQGEWDVGDDLALHTADGWLVELAVALMDTQTLRDSHRGWVSRPKRVFWPPQTHTK